MNSKQQNKAKKAITEESDLYSKWLDFLFNRPTNGIQSYLDFDCDEFGASNEQLVHLVGRTFAQSGSDLLKYTDDQVAVGLSFIFFNHASEVIYSIVQEGVPDTDREQAALNLKYLYRDCFAKRCANVLSHINEPGCGSLNRVCYMLWDDSPLGRWTDVVLEVMEYALYIPNYACVESALHGLGHRHCQTPEKVEEIVDRFLSKSISLRRELRQYAAKAKYGDVQ